MTIESIQFHKDRRLEVFNLLSQLTDAPCINQYDFENILYNIRNNHHIYVYIKDNKLVGIITLLIEQKLIHNGKCVGHIEDLVVDQNYNGQGIATELLCYATSIAKNNNCYKVILDCKRELISFYEKNEFKENQIQMTNYF
jgi:glucosamine-phosphate N-acetyltransferase